MDTFNRFLITDENEKWYLDPEKNYGNLKFDAFLAQKIYPKRGDISVESMNYHEKDLNIKNLTK